MGNKTTLSRQEQAAFKKTYSLPRGKFKSMVKAFKREAKQNKGKITREQFLNTYARHGIMDIELGNQVFDSFDRDKNGLLDIREYLSLMGVAYGGTLEQKLKASFEVFDKDGDGELSKDEIRDIIVIIIKQIERTRLREGSSNPYITGETPVTIDKDGQAKIEKMLNEVFDVVDTDGSGTIDEDEFITGFKKHGDVCEFFNQF
mmetsp:Transcript_17911/g.19938  ORF Transcript_17911/g.19938 Transcript_17911/m.19938 type:complete len:203 (-) Transcript_17911:108-716(-)